MNEISIDNLRLSTRSTNALKRAGILTLEQLIRLNVDDLYNIGNIGKKSVKMSSNRFIVKNSITNILF